ncbi:Endocytosis protein end4 [Fusarium oxysporum f. sp. albedinis]|nr:Endocytosis protein end4 [Fusarium oxysporum f. sp. albedinis]
MLFGKLCTSIISKESLLQSCRISSPQKRTSVVSYTLPPQRLALAAHHLPRPPGIQPTLSTNSPPICQWSDLHRKNIWSCCRPCLGFSDTTQPQPGRNVQIKDNEDTSVVTLPPLFQMGISENVHSSINKQQWNQHRYDLFNLLVDNIPPLKLYDSANESLVSLLAITKWKYLDIPRAPNRQCVKKADCFDVLPFYYYLVAQRSALEEPLIQMLVLILRDRHELASVDSSSVSTLWVLMTKTGVNATRYEAREMR